MNKNRVFIVRNHDELKFIINYFITNNMIDNKKYLIYKNLFTKTDRFFDLIFYEHSEISNGIGYDFLYMIKNLINDKYHIVETKDLIRLDKLKELYNEI